VNVMTSKTTAAGARMEEIKARKYVTDILAGLVPSDELYDPIFEIVARHGGCEFERRAASINIIGMADEIKAIRTIALAKTGGAS